MTRHHSRAHLMGLMALVIAALPSLAAAQVSSLAVTALSNGESGSFVIENEEEALHLGTTLETGLLKVSAGKQVMVFCDGELNGARSGAVIIVLGPAEVAIDLQGDRVIFELRSGRMMASSDQAQSGQIVYFRASVQNRALLELPLAQGETDLLIEGDRAELGLPLGGAESLTLTMDGAPRTLPAGKIIVVRGADANEADIGDWSTRNGFGFDVVSSELSVRSARAARIAVQGRLLDNVIAWDKYAQAENIAPEAEANKPQPEIRQVVTSVQSNVQRNSNRGGSPQTPNVQGANEVPSLSPAAVAVGGVTAVQVNNQNAANLLTRTQSRGLGFNGPAQLATPGFLGGRRTVGPPGLGAQRSK